MTFEGVQLQGSVKIMEKLTVRLCIIMTFYINFIIVVCFVELNVSKN